MGFKTSNYNVTKLGITVNNAYAQITDLSIDIDGNARAVFSIQQSRDTIKTSRPLDRKFVNISIDKELPVHKQVYEAAKLTHFAEWEDDIVEVETIKSIENVEELTNEVI